MNSSIRRVICDDACKPVEPAVGATASPQSIGLGLPSLMAPLPPCNCSLDYTLESVVLANEVHPAQAKACGLYTTMRARFVGVEIENSAR